ncbi:hypothetical protein BT93_L3097 [Corymbia citriodora subsp. variegata]|uniref:Uncharacterized protein n=1 Tax=Corymbia citriodora subsp. variegata TaxID=360336 RepID=A0A8T0CI06_CORYI|nr:hypothetical protein BT93_L3097 [Corymbia citriodora subsp. variegata]
MACRPIGLLANHLPTDFFSFERLSGLSSCENRAVTIMLLSTFGAACFFSCFTDSFRVCGRTHFTLLSCDNGSRGQSCSCNSCNNNNNNQRRDTWRLPQRGHGVRTSDFIHAITLTADYAAFVFSNPNVMDRFYPCAPSWLLQFLQWLRLLIFIPAAAVFCKFPTHRRGIGFAVVTARPCSCTKRAKNLSKEGSSSKAQKK